MYVVSLRVIDLLSLCSFLISACACMNRTNLVIVESCVSLTVYIVLNGSN